MNRHLHRVVFNAARGLRMVVAERGVRTGGAGSTGDTGSTGTRDAGSAGRANTCRTDPRTPWWRPTAALSALSALSARPNLLGLVGLAALALLPAHSAQAQIVANPFAPGSQRPQVLVAPNGTPLINITAPSAAGVSVNGYSRFDVHGIGAILNNSRHPTQTQLGGIVGGNPWLLGGAARLIVNQIASEHPSHLNGPIEVAGQRAEVVIANPAGISIRGGGFINAKRVTLTTGVPQLDAFGGLQGYTVRDGTITVGKGGLDASRTDYAAILARAVELNDAIWANHLKVVTGANEVSGDHARITPIQGTGTRPKFALDVAALGGMYSGSIFLTGTEHGLGVRHAGHIGAGPGGFVVTADGWLLNLGEIQSGGDVNRMLHPVEAQLIKDNAERFARQVFGTDTPTEEQIREATAMLATAAQRRLDNNMGYDLPYSQAADDFLQTLKIEYMQAHGTLVLPDTRGTQQLFYATVDQKNQPALNQGWADPAITGLIVRTPLSSAQNNPHNDPTRDRMTGLPLDEQGRYTVLVEVEGVVYAPKFHPCATAECVASGQNLDMADPATVAYVRAIDKKIINDINKAAAVAAIASPLGVIGVLGQAFAIATSMASGFLNGNETTMLAKEVLNEAAIKYITRVYGLSESVATQIANLIDIAGGWQAFIERIQEEL